MWFTGFTGPLRDGDWVRATARIPVTFSDHLVDGGIAKGTRGVVVGEPRGFLRPTVPVRFDGGFGGTRSVDVPIASLRRSGRGRGPAEFERRTQLLGLIRLGVAIALVLPLIYFVGSYLWTHRTFDGLLSALAIGVIDSAGALIESALLHPVHTVVFLLVSWALGRFAFGRKP